MDAAVRHWVDLWDYLDGNFWGVWRWAEKNLSPDEVAWQPVPQVASIGWNLQHLGEMLDYYLAHIFKHGQPVARDLPTMRSGSQDDSRFRDLQAIAKASSGNFAMMQGKAPFDLAKLQDGLKTMGAEGAKFKALFPDDSKTGGETEASAKIWQAKADFNKAADALAAAVSAAQTSIKDEASLKAEYPKVARSCGGCHMETDGFAPRLADIFKRVK